MFGRNKIGKICLQMDRLLKGLQEMLRANDLEEFSKLFKNFCKEREVLYNQNAIRKAVSGDFSELRATKEKHNHTAILDLFYSELNKFKDEKENIDFALEKHDLKAVEHAFHFFEMVWLGVDLPDGHKGLLQYIRKLTELGLV